MGHKSPSTLLARAHRRIALYLKFPNRVTPTLSNTFNLAAPQNDTTSSRFVVYDYSSAVWSFDLKMTQQPRLHSSLGYIVGSQYRHFNERLPAAGQWQFSQAAHSLGFAGTRFAQANPS